MTVIQIWYFIISKTVFILSNIDIGDVPWTIKTKKNEWRMDSIILYERIQWKLNNRNEQLNRIMNFYVNDKESTEQE